VTEAEWLACADPQKMLEFLRSRASDRKLRLFSAACCRRVWHLLVHDWSRDAVKVVERYADGAATFQELEDAKSNAWEFSDHIIHSDEHFYDLDANAQNAADAPAWAAERSEDYGSEVDGGCPHRVVTATQRALGAAEGNAQADLVRCIFANPLRPLTISPDILSWNDGVVVRLAQTAYDDRHMPAGILDNTRLLILADALEEAGCTDSDTLGHLRRPGPHVRGCWPVDLCLGKS